jgi:hypothetical protein
LARLGGGLAIGCCKRSFKTTATAATSETTATHEGKTIEILLSFKTVSFNLVSNEDSSQQMSETTGPGWSFLLQQVEISLFMAAATNVLWQKCSIKLLSVERNRVKKSQ